MISSSSSCAWPAYEGLTGGLETSSIDPAIADEVFPRLDTNGDGRITAAEWEKLFLEYFLSDDADAPGSWLWGPF